MRRIAGVIAALIFIVALGQYLVGQAAHATVATMPPATPTPLVSIECARAFDYAARIAKDKMADSVTDLDQAVRDCRSVAEWTAASAAHPGAISAGVDPVVFLRNRCSLGDLSGTTLCALVR